MTTNGALAELESTADVGEAKRDLVLRFVRDQEALQTTQVELKLVDDDTIDLIDSAFTANEIALQQNNDQTHGFTRNNEEILRAGVSGMTLNDQNREHSGTQRQRPPSGRPQSRRAQRKTSSDFKEKRKRSSHSRRVDNIERLADNNPMSPLPVDVGASFNAGHPYGQTEMDENAGLNSSWPQQVLSRKSSYQKHAIYAPEKHLLLEGTGFESANNHCSRPMTSQSFQRLATGEAVIAARVRKHSANNRITCDFNQMIDSPIHPRSSSPAKSVSRRSTSRGRSIINLGLEPVDPSEIPMLRAASAGKASLSGPYSFVQLPPISREAPAATPPS